MRVATATDPGNPLGANEDWVTAAQSLIVVLDGATARTETGCIHGVSWYAAKLGSTITSLAIDHDQNLGTVLSNAISMTARQHNGCDLRHPGTPSATVAILRLTEDVLEYLVLGDTTILVDAGDTIQVLSDARVDATARAERAEANRHPLGSAEKQAALLRMKHAELAARNQPGGFWVAAADPTVVTHAITGKFPMDRVRRAAVLTDGAARIVTLFDLLDWHSVLDVLNDEGPTELIHRVRAIEAADPIGIRWPATRTATTRPS